MSDKHSAQANQVIETIKHLRFDCEEACLIRAILLSLDKKIEGVPFEELQLGVRKSTALVQRALLTRLILILTRAHDHWSKTGPNRDRKCLPSIFGILEEQSSAFSELVVSDGQLRLYRNASEKWHKLKKQYSFNALEVMLKFHSGQIDKTEYDVSLKKSGLTEMVRSLRNQVLAHNLPQSSPKPTGMEIDSLLGHTVEIVEPLSEAFCGVSVSFDAVRSVCDEQANEYWRNWTFSLSEKR